eukprot:10079417-Alexandrium_andersonii.AAC.1
MPARHALSARPAVRRGTPEWISKAPSMAEEGEAELGLDEDVLEAALLEAEATALAEGEDGGAGARQAVAALPAGWWRAPDGGAMPTYADGSAPPVQRERPSGAPPLRLGEQLGDWRCPRQERGCPAWHRKRSPECRVCHVARPP